MSAKCVTHCCRPTGDNREASNAPRLLATGAWCVARCGSRKADQAAPPPFVSTRPDCRRAPAHRRARPLHAPVQIATVPRAMVWAIKETKGIEGAIKRAQELAGKRKAA